jgi:hypothetical protein
MLTLVIAVESQRSTEPVFFMVLSALAFVIGITLFLFRKQAMRWAARSYRGDIYDESTPTGRRTYLISFVIAPALMCLIALYGLVYAASELW